MRYIGFLSYTGASLDRSVENAAAPSVNEAICREISDDLQDIEDKLYENGLIATATSDPDAEVSISFGDYCCDGEAGPYWIVAISSSGAPQRSDSKFEDIADFVAEKISECSAFWLSEVRSVTDSSWGNLVFLNGRIVY